MKKILLCVAGIVLVIYSFCQAIETTLTKDDYLKKAKGQKTVGSILIGGGLVTVTVGMTMGLKGFSKGWDWTHPQSGESEMNTGTVLAIAGGVLIAAGIPFMIAARKNKKRALSAGVMMEKIPAMSPGSGRIYQLYPAISLQLHLGKTK